MFRVMVQGRRHKNKNRWSWLWRCKRNSYNKSSTTFTHHFTYTAVLVTSCSTNTPRPSPTTSNTPAPKPPTSTQPITYTWHMVSPRSTNMILTPLFNTSIGHSSYSQKQKLKRFNRLYIVQWRRLRGRKYVTRGHSNVQNS